MARTSGKLKWYGKVILGIGVVLLLEMIVGLFAMRRWDDRLPNLDKSYDDHVFLAARGYGDSFSLTGDVRVSVVFVNDPQAQWTDEGRSTVMKQILAQTIILKDAAKEYGAELNLTANYYYVTVDVPYDAENYHKWAMAALEKMNYTTDNASSLVKKNHSVKEAPYMFCTPRNGRSFARAVKQDGVFEYGVLYADGTAYAHELSHLFGAVDFYYPEQVRLLAEDCFDSSIMLDADTRIFDSLTAYLVGWTDEVSEEALRFLDETAWITKDIRHQQHQEETVTGYGTRKNKNSTYTGQMVRGMPHGTGRMEMSDGSVYEGQFHYGIRQGQGKYTWEDGASYEGQFENNKLHGQGVYTWSDGTVYEGEFFEGKRHGQGKLTYPDGKKLTGTWENGEYVQ